MSNYDGPSYLNNDQPKMASIQGEPKDKKVPKYELPDSVRTREDLQKEADRYMETPSYTNRRFRSTQVPKSLQNLDGWKVKRRNEPLIEEIRQRLAKEPSDYLLFEEFMDEEEELEKQSELDSEAEVVSISERTSEPEVEPKLEPKEVEQKSNRVNLIKEDLVQLNFKQKSPASKQGQPKKSSHKKIVRSSKKNGTKKIKQNTGLKRSLSNIIADDKKAMEHWNSNLDSLFINEKK